MVLGFCVKVTLPESRSKSVRPLHYRPNSNFTIVSTELSRLDGINETSSGSSDERETTYRAPRMCTYNICHGRCTMHEEDTQDDTHRASQDSI